MKPEKPPRVADHYLYWTEPPPEESARCTYWLAKIKDGWRPNRRLRGECYDCSSEILGIYIWEYFNKFQPALTEAMTADGTLPVRGIKLKLPWQEE